MIILERDGSLLWTHPDSPVSDATRGTIDVPASALTQSNNVIDRILDFAFDVLGLQTIELRIHEDAEQTVA